MNDKEFNKIINDERINISEKMKVKWDAGDIDVKKLIQEVTNEIAKFLIEKNEKYGNSALNPPKIFSKLNPIEGINVRLNDKIARLMSDQENEDEDVEKDLIGYIVLKMVLKRIYVKYYTEEYEKLPDFDSVTLTYKNKEAAFKSIVNLSSSDDIKGNFKFEEDGK